VDGPWGLWQTLYKPLNEAELKIFFAFRSTSGSKTSSKEKSQLQTSLSKSQPTKNNNFSEKTKEEKIPIAGETRESSETDMIQNLNGRLIGGGGGNLLHPDMNIYSNPGFPNRWIINFII